MLPKGTDPLFPNKHPAGHDVFGRPFYDMAATGLTVNNTTLYDGLEAVYWEQQRQFREAIGMAKNNEPVATELPTVISCPDCGGERFQVHERGTVILYPDNVLSVEYDAIALACQGCHHVQVMDVRGVIDYQG